MGKDREYQGTKSDTFHPKNRDDQGKKSYTDHTPYQKDLGKTSHFKEYNVYSPLPFVFPANKHHIIDQVETICVPVDNNPTPNLVPDTGSTLAMLGLSVFLLIKFFRKVS